MHEHFLIWLDDLDGSNVRSWIKPWVAPDPRLREPEYVALRVYSFRDYHFKRLAGNRSNPDPDVRYFFAHQYLRVRGNSGSPTV